MSVDIDLDFVPNLTREETVNERERLTEILKGFMSEQGYSFSEASRFSHSLDAFHYNYVNAAARDLYDFCNMADINLFAGEEDLFRKCIIFYATISAKEVNKNFDTSAIDSLVFSKIKSDLFPVLAVKDKFDLEGKKQQAKEYIASLMKLTAQEMEYMERFIAKEYKPELLMEDAEIIERTRNHPMALWKCK